MGWVCMLRLSRLSTHMSRAIDPLIRTVLYCTVLYYTVLHCTYSSWLAGWLIESRGPNGSTPQD